MIVLTILFSGPWLPRSVAHLNDNYDNNDNNNNYNNDNNNNNNNNNDIYLSIYLSIYLFTSIYLSFHGKSKYRKYSSFKICHHKKIARTNTFEIQSTYRVFQKYCLHY